MFFKMFTPLSSPPLFLNRLYLPTRLRYQAVVAKPTIDSAINEVVRTNLTCLRLYEKQIIAPTR